MELYEAGEKIRSHRRRRLRHAGSIVLVHSAGRISGMPALAKYTSAGILLTLGEPGRHPRRQRELAKLDVEMGSRLYSSSRY